MSSCSSGASELAFGKMRSHVEITRLAADADPEGKGTPRSEPVKLADNAMAGASSVQVRELQNRLRAAGYYRGKIDGISGPLTQRALAEFTTANRHP